MAKRHFDSINGLVLGEWLRSKLMLSAYDLVRLSGSQGPTELTPVAERNLLVDFSHWRLAAERGNADGPATLKSTLGMACASVDILFMADAVVRRTASDPEAMHVDGFGRLVADYEMWRLLASDLEPVPRVGDGLWPALGQRTEAGAWLRGFRQRLAVNPDYERPGSAGAADLADGGAILEAIQAFDRFAATYADDGNVHGFIPEIAKEAIRTVARKMREVAEPGDRRDQCDTRLLHVEMPLLVAAIERHLW